MFSVGKRPFYALAERHGRMSIIRLFNEFDNYFTGPTSTRTCNGLKSRFFSQPKFRALRCNALGSWFYVRRFLK